MKVLTFINSSYILKEKLKIFKKEINIYYKLNNCMIV